ncbi:MAG: CsgG/HfaB family protein [Lentisphaerota bacterium]
MRYRNSFLGLLTVITALTFSSIEIQAEEQLAKGEQLGIYVGQLEVQPSVAEAARKAGKELSLKRTAQSLDTQFISALSATRVFQMLERKRKADLEQEQGYSATAVDINDKNAAQLGKMAGAKYALLPQIDGFEDMVDIQEYKDIERFSMRRKLYMSVTVTVVDTTTGKYLPDVANVQLSREEVVNNARNTKFLEGSDALNVELAKDMASSLCQEIVSLIRPAKVLTITGQQVMINRGTPAGFKQGVEVEFFASEDVKDEESGETFRNEVSVGKGTITRSDAKQSYAKIAGTDLGITKGCVIKVVKPTSISKGQIPESAPGGDFPENPAKILADDAQTTPGSSEKPLQFDLDNKVDVPPSDAAAVAPPEGKISNETTSSTDTNK